MSGCEKPTSGRWRTPPFDPRFPNQNQTRNCYQNFLDYHRCFKKMSLRGKSTQPCEYYFHVFHSLCPMSWVRGQGGANPPDWAWGAGPADVSRHPYLPPAPPQVQRWTEQIRDETFAGKI
ncbi:cytochrome c oxidase subunit 6B2 isoform 2-T2 [Hipposideros larvatus]